MLLAQTHSKKWQKSLQHERDQRIRLEETLEQLAKQHNHLERAFRGATVLPAGAAGTAGSAKGTDREPLPAPRVEDGVKRCRAGPGEAPSDVPVGWGNWEGLGPAAAAAPRPPQTRVAPPKET